MLGASSQHSGGAPVASLFRQLPRQPALDKNLVPDDAKQQTVALGRSLNRPRSLGLQQRRPAPACQRLLAHGSQSAVQLVTLSAVA